MSSLTSFPSLSIKDGSVSRPVRISIVGTDPLTKTRSTETVWNDDPRNASGEGTGGGYSRYFPVQSFQAGAPSGPGRMVPDLAANADRHTGYEVFVHGEQVVVGGTSAVAPLYAGLFAALGTKLGFVTPKLWANHLCFNDITQGDNGYYRARIGPDPCTGLGSPIGMKLEGLFKSLAPLRMHDRIPVLAPDGRGAPGPYVYAQGALIRTARAANGRENYGREAQIARS
jgi:hypothetical protein